MNKFLSMDYRDYGLVRNLISRLADTLDNALDIPFDYDDDFDGNKAVRLHSTVIQQLKGVLPLIDDLRKEIAL